MVADITGQVRKAYRDARGARPRPGLRGRGDGDAMKPHEDHRAHAGGGVRVRIVTVSSSRFAKKDAGEEYTDEGGDTAVAEVRRAGHRVRGRDLISDDPKMIRHAVEDFLSGEDDVLLFTGGTGVSPRDVTIESVRPYFEKELEGFGELLRRLSYDEIGAAGVLSRAAAGVVQGRLVACMPGSPGAVKTCLGAFAGEFSHVVFIAGGQGRADGRRRRRSVHGG